MGSLESQTDGNLRCASVSLYFQGSWASQGVRMSKSSGEGIPV